MLYASCIIILVCYRYISWECAGKQNVLRSKFVCCQCSFGGGGKKNEQVDGTLTFLFILTLGKASDKKSVAACWSYCHAFIIKVWGNVCTWGGRLCLHYRQCLYESWYSWNGTWYIKNPQIFFWETTVSSFFEEKLESWPGKTYMLLIYCFVFASLKYVNCK